MTRFLAPLLAAILAAPAFAEGAPQQIPIQLTPPKSNVTIRTVTLDASGGVSPEGQKVLDQMIEEGWRAQGITTVATGNPVTIAVMFARPTRPAQPPQPPQGQQPPPPPQNAAPRPAPLPAPLPPPVSNEHNP